MYSVPLAVGRTQPITVTSLPSLTSIFDLVVFSLVCAPRPTPRAAATEIAPMSFIRSLRPGFDATTVPDSVLALLIVEPEFTVFHGGVRRCRRFEKLSLSLCLQTWRFR